LSGSSSPAPGNPSSANHASSPSLPGEPPLDRGALFRRLRLSFEEGKGVIIGPTAGGEKHGRPSTRVKEWFFLTPTLCCSSETPISRLHPPSPFCSTQASHPNEGLGTAIFFSETMRGSPRFVEVHCNGSLDGDCRTTVP
jgi:hypothetical protein